MKYLILATLAIAALISMYIHRPSFGATDGVQVHYQKNIPLKYTFVTVTTDGKTVFDATPRVLQQRIDALEYEINARQSRKWTTRQPILDNLKEIQISVNTKLGEYPDVATTTKPLPTVKPITQP